MEAELADLLDVLDYRAIQINQIELAKERFRVRRVLMWDGHSFDLTQEFILYASARMAEEDYAILLDRNEEPVLIEAGQKQEFLAKMNTTYNEALNEYHDRYAKMKKARNSMEVIEAA